MSTTKFRDLVDYDIGGGWGTEEAEPGSSSVGYVIRGTDIPRVAVGDVSTVPRRFHKASNLKSRVLAPGDIVFEVSGGSKGQPVGRALQITDKVLAKFDEPVMCASFCKLVRIDSTKAVPGYIFRLLQAAYADGGLDTYQVQSTGITNFKWKPFLDHFVVDLPARHEQKQVAAILDVFDDLIESNRRRVEVLEEMARAIYREWFVKFRYPGHEDVPLADSSMGPIPEGWQVHPFSAVVDYHIGGGWGTEREEPGSEEPAYVIRGTDIPRAARLDVTGIPFRFHRESNLRTRKLRPDDIVFEVSGGSKGQPVGRSLLIRQSLLDEFDAPTMCASFCKLVRANPTIAEPSILIRLLQDAYTSGHLDPYQVQSTGITNFRWKPFLEHFEVALPPEQLQKELVQTFDRLDDLVANTGRRNGVLTQIRDMLLPRLVSGQIEMSSLDLDALVGELVA